jgi:hypothetical protein
VITFLPHFGEALRTRTHSYITRAILHCKSDLGYNTQFDQERMA